MSANNSDKSDGSKRSKRKVKRSPKTNSLYLSATVHKDCTLDDEWSLYSVDQDGFYTSMHTDSGIKKSTMTLVPIDGVLTDCADAPHVASIKSDSKQTLTRSGKKSRTKYSEHTPPTPPKRRSSSLTRSADSRKAENSDHDSEETLTGLDIHSKIIRTSSATTAFCQNIAPKLEKSNCKEPELPYGEVDRLMISDEKFDRMVAVGDHQQSGMFNFSGKESKLTYLQDCDVETAETEDLSTRLKQKTFTSPVGFPSFCAITPLNSDDDDADLLNFKHVLRKDNISFRLDNSLNKVLAQHSLDVATSTPMADAQENMNDGITRSASLKSKAVPDACSVDDVNHKQAAAEDDTISNFYTWPCSPVFKTGDIIKSILKPSRNDQDLCANQKTIQFCMQEREQGKIETVGIKSSLETIQMISFQGTAICSEEINVDVCDGELPVLDVVNNKNCADDSALPSKYKPEIRVKPKKRISKKKSSPIANPDDHGDVSNCQTKVFVNISQNCATPRQVSANQDCSLPAPAHARLVISAPLVSHTSYVDNHHKRAVCRAITSEELDNFTVYNNPDRWYNTLPRNLSPKQNCSATADKSVVDDKFSKSLDMTMTNSNDQSSTSQTELKSSRSHDSTKPRRHHKSSCNHSRGAVVVVDPMNLTTSKKSPRVQSQENAVSKKKSYSGNNGKTSNTDALTLKFEAPPPPLPSRSSSLAASVPHHSYKSNTLSYGTQLQQTSLADNKQILLDHKAGTKMIPGFKNELAGKMLAAVSKVRARLDDWHDHNACQQHQVKSMNIYDTALAGFGISPSLVQSLNSLTKSTDSLSSTLSAAERAVVTKQAFLGSASMEKLDVVEDSISKLSFAKLEDVTETPSGIEDGRNIEQGTDTLAAIGRHLNKQNLTSSTISNSSGLGSSVSESPVVSPDTDTVISPGSFQKDNTNSGFKCNTVAAALKKTPTRTVVSTKQTSV